MILEQDIAAMEGCFEKLPVKPGDVYVVPGGWPHAIGGGVLMVEVMEPTDFVARVEFNVAGRVIPESARFMNRDVDFALDMFSFEPAPPSTMQSRCHGQPRTIDRTAALHREALVDERLTDRFSVLRTTLFGRSPWRAYGFTVLLVVEGSCEIATASEKASLSRFDRIVVPSGMDALEITSQNGVVLLECLPPGTATH
jgi:mannose-6-phosphate isomerase